MLLWLSFCWSGFILALAGYFYASVAWAFFFIGAFFIFRQAKKKRVSLKPSWELWVVSIAVLTAAIVFSFFTTPTIFSGRDQGSISEAAIRLAQNHKLTFSTPASEAFFKLHESGRALNFPGFYYTSQGSLTTQFPLVYIVWLALFYAPLGLNGLIIANAVLFVFFLLSFYLLVRLFTNIGIAALGLLFVLTSFGMTWFVKFTLSENMALMLLWISILTLMLFIYQQRKLHLFLLFASSALLSFTRIEGFAFFVVLILILALNKDTRKYLSSNSWIYVFLPILFFAGIFLANAANDMAFYKELAKALLPTITLPKASYLGQITHMVLPSFYLLRIFGVYGMLSFFITGTFGLLVLAIRKDLYRLIPFFVVAPTIVYFVNSNISPDHPWMLRRFIFSLLPGAIFYSLLLIDSWIKKHAESGCGFILKSTPYLLVIILLGMNLPAFTAYATYSENKGLLEQTNALGQQFQPDDLILVDQKASGDGWNMITGPMSFVSNRNTVYFFNVQDLNKLDLKPFNTIYLIVPDSNTETYTNSTFATRLTIRNSYSLSTDRLSVSTNDPNSLLSLPKKKTITVQGKIFTISKQ